LWVRTLRADGSESGYFATCYDPEFSPEELAEYPREGRTLPRSQEAGAHRPEGGTDAIEAASIYAQLARYRYIDAETGVMDRDAFESLPDASALRLDPTADKAKVYAELQEILGQASQDYAELERNGYVANGKIQAKFWEVADETGLEGTYADRRLVFNKLRAHKSLDVFANQLDGLWAWIAMGEAPEDLLDPARVKMILETIFANNRVTNGWATQRTAEGGEVESDQGKDVWIATNYVLAQMLDYCGMTEESKEVYQVMDEVLLQRDNTSTSPESIRPDENKFIVKGYPRPGAVWTQLPLFFLKARKRSGGKGATAEELAEFVRGIFDFPGASIVPTATAGDRDASGGNEMTRGPSGGRLPYGLGRIRPGAAAPTAMPGGGGAAGSVLA
jgi:hypothetical protein